jgi:hypothetical protein
MSLRNRNTISARLWSLPGQLLLALINATAILVIVAAILALAALARVDRFAKRTAETITESVLAKIDLPPKEVLANLRNLSAEVRMLGNSIRELKTGENAAAIQLQIGQLRESLAGVDRSVNRLGSARSLLTDEAIGQLGRTVGDTLKSLRGCAAGVAHAAPHPTL